MQMVKGFSRFVLLLTAVSGLSSGRPVTFSEVVWAVEGLFEGRVLKQEIEADPY